MLCDRGYQLPRKDALWCAEAGNGDRRGRQAHIRQRLTMLFYKLECVSVSPFEA